MRRCIYNLPGRAGGGCAGHGWRGRGREGGREGRALPCPDGGGGRRLRRVGFGRASGRGPALGLCFVRSAAPGVWASARRFKQCGSRPLPPPPPPWPYLVSRRGPLAQASSLPGETASWRLFPVPYTRRSVRGSPGAALLRSILCFPRPDLGTGRDGVGAPSGEVVRCAAGLVLSIPSQPGLGGD